jgi:hypothetical protein
MSLSVSGQNYLPEGCTTCFRVLLQPLVGTSHVSENRWDGATNCPGPGSPGSARRPSRLGMTTRRPPMSWRVGSWDPVTRRGGGEHPMYCGRRRPAVSGDSGEPGHMLRRGLGAGTLHNAGSHPRRARRYAGAAPPAGPFIALTAGVRTRPPLSGPAGLVRPDEQREPQGKPLGQRGYRSGHRVLKAEPVYLSEVRARLEATAAIVDRTEIFCRQQRLDSALAYHSPTEKAQTTSAQQAPAPTLRRPRS